MFDEYFEEPMDEEQLRQLISSLCILSKEGTIPCVHFQLELFHGWRRSVSMCKEFLQTLLPKRFDVRRQCQLDNTLAQTGIIKPMSYPADAGVPRRNALEVKFAQILCAKKLVFSIHRTTQAEMHTFSVLVSAAPCEKLAHHLHQRWLSEQNFTKIAAHIILHRQHMYETDLGLFSCCLAHVLSDYRSRHQIRKENRLVFRNSVRALLDFYPVYNQIDATVSECLVEPMFTSLDELIRDEADEKDVEAVAEMIIEHGDMLLKIRPGQCDRFIMALRTCLCDCHFRSATRRLILQAIDLWTYKWDDEMIPFCIKQFNETSMELQKNPKDTSESPSESSVDRQESVV